MSVFDNIVITEIEAILSIPSPNGRFIEMKNRSSYGLSFCKSGQITYVQNGEKTVSDRFHAIILPKGGNYTLYGDRTGVFPVINFSTLLPFTDRFLKIELQSPEIYIKDAERMQSLLASGNKAKVFSLMYRLLDRLKNEGGQGILLRPAVKYMEENFYDRNITNTKLAEQMKISEVYFRRLFKETYGTTPHRFLLELRLEKAKQLLSDNRVSVTRIAEDCGFSGVYHFCKTFKDAVGVTPTAYRKALEKIEI